MPELFNGTLQTTIADDERFGFNKPGVAGTKNILWSAFKTLLSTLYCSLTGDQTIAGIKTFSSSPQVPDPTGSLDAVNFQTLSGIGAALKVNYPNKTSDFQHLISADQSLERIDFRKISGSITIKVGTSANGDDIIIERTLTSEDKNINLGKSFSSSKTLYITITGGGTVSVNIWYLPAIW